MSTYINRKRLEILGKEFTTNNYGTCVVIEYNNALDVAVKFYNPECVTKCRVGDLVRGEVCNPLFPNFYGRGYIGVGRFNSKNTRAYSVWRGMLERAYSNKVRRSLNAYKDVTVCEDWWNFQNFAEWCEKQEFFGAKDINGESYALDKDIVVKGNRVYSPDACSFVPRAINSLFISKPKYFLKYDLPIGVTFCKRTGKFSAKFTSKNKCVNLGRFNSSNEAFEAYKHAKELHIKAEAREWKGRIDDKVYEALMNWEVCTDD